MLLLSFFLLIQSILAFKIDAIGDVLPGKKNYFRVSGVSRYFDFEIHDIRGNILSTSTGLEGSRVSIYVPLHIEGTFLVAACDDDKNKATTQPLFI